MSVPRRRGGRTGRTDDGERNWHKNPDKVVDDFEHGPFLGAKELPGPRGENEGVPGGDGQRAHEEVLVGGQVWWELEGVWKEACVGFAVSSGQAGWTQRGRTDDVGHGCEGRVQRKGERACLE